MIEVMVAAGLWPAIGIFGLLIGSFLNVVVHRLPIMMRNELRLDCEWLAVVDAGEPEPDFTQPDQPTYNLNTPRSTRPKCDTQLLPGTTSLSLAGYCWVVNVVTAPPPSPCATPLWKP